MNNAKKYISTINKTIFTSSLLGTIFNLFSIRFLFVISERNNRIDEKKLGTDD